MNFKIENKFREKKKYRTVYTTETTTCSLEIILFSHIFYSTQGRRGEKTRRSQLKVLKPLYLLKLDFQYTSIY